jgi:tetratricopeptide (TPR) repeat protein
MPQDANHAGVSGGGGGGGMQPAVREALQKAKDNPKDFDAQIRAAGMYYQIGQNDQAREYLQHAYDLKPDGMEYEALIALGQLDIQGGKNKEAQPVFERAIKLKPNETEGYTGLGNVYRVLKDFDKAIAQFNKALNIQPKDEDALHEMAHAYIDKGDARNAETTINRLNDVNPKTDNIASLRQELDQLKLTGKIPSH